MRESETNTRNLPKVMILEDDALLLGTLTHMSDALGVDHCGVQNGVQALERTRDFEPDAYFVDLEMPLMNGWEFIERAKMEKPDSIFVVMTANSEPRTIIETMNLGVFDYILKPVDTAEYKSVLDDIVVELQRRKKKRLFEEESDLRLKEQLNWVSYKRSKLTELDLMVELSKNTLNSVKYALLSGGGIGTLISLVKMIRGVSDRKDSNFVVPSELMDMLIENTEYIETNVNRLEETLTLLNRDIEPKIQTVYVSDLIAALREKYERFLFDERQYIEEKNLVFQMSNSNLTLKKEQVRIDAESISTVFHELLVNALKYSAKGSVIDVYFAAKGGLFNLFVKNRFDSESLVSISQEQEILVKQPFYRLAKFLDEKVKSEYIFSGLGLTLVDIVARKHGGSFGIKNVRDHSADSGPESVVLAALTLSTV
ncbi:response regulator [Leptospira ellisii]|uniref:Response regulator n=1 Tax=Leptospira ellisii TaxID=2023197 RepID=A0AAE4QMQ6_9LEPT|nr:response regulator [Leptospira ellisii]MDV6235813.1 response regulator [Leptospira ellisii]